MNTAYKHLDTKLRIAELTLGQWVGVTVGCGLAIVWGFFLSPLGTYLTIFSTVYVGAIPIGVVVLASYTEFDLGILVRSAIRWRRRDGRFIQGPGPATRGYVVRGEPEAEHERQREPLALNLEDLWES
jgi:hypothetical protein